MHFCYCRTFYKFKQNTNIFDSAYAQFLHQYFSFFSFLFFSTINKFIKIKFHMQYWIDFCYFSLSLSSHFFISDNEKTYKLWLVEKYKKFCHSLVDFLQHDEKNIVVSKQMYDKDQFYSIFICSYIIYINLLFLLSNEVAHLTD